MCSSPSALIPSASSEAVNTDDEVIEEEDEEEEVADDDGGDEDDDDPEEGMEALLKEGDHSPPLPTSPRPKKEISHIAATAESLQPKGYTLATTKVSTRRLHHQHHHNSHSSCCTCTHKW